jgi:hypothetical protein
MAFKKNTIRQQFTEALGPLLEPGEQVRAGGYAVSGPSPLLTGAIGIVLMLLLGMRYYYLAVTDRRVLFMRASLFSQRPKGLAFAYPVSSVSITATTMARLWSNFRLQPPGGKPIRLNFHKIWRDEMQQVARAIESSPRSPGAPAGAADVPPPPPPPPAS